MRVFALSDVHVDHALNRQWIEQLSTADYTQDVLILAGDVSDSLVRLAWCLRQLARRFRQVLFVPGNHDLWVVRDQPERDSFDKFALVCACAQASAVSMAPFTLGGLTIVPLLGWYDDSFGAPGPQLRAAWLDYHACRWPPGYDAAAIAGHFLARNPRLPAPGSETVITFSHFLPRRELAPQDPALAFLLPVMGSARLDEQVRTLGARVHVYGHSHAVQRRDIDGVTYLNNALGNPRERALSVHSLLQVCER